MAKKKEQQLNKAVIYARFSSHNQREESIEQQIDECTRYAEAQGLNIIGIYSDIAISGRSDKRPQFQRLRRDAKGEGFDYIIAYKSNRIARNLLNALTFENEMEGLGVKVVYAKEEFGDNPTGRFALRMMMNVNQFYSENLAEDIKRNQLANARECKVNGPASYGYKRGADGKFAIDETAAETVREIFERVLNGEPFVDIARDLNRRGIKTRRGGEWNKSSFANILNNERYIGTYIHSGIRIEGGMPAIITKEMFYQVRDTLQSKNNPQGRHRENDDYLLTGKLICGSCNTHMVGMSGTGKNGVIHHYYVCSKKRLSGECEKKNVKRDSLEFKVAEAILKKLLTRESIEWITEKTLLYQQTAPDSAERLELKQSLTEVEKQLKNLLAAIESGIVTPTTKERLLELEEQRAQIKEKLELFKSNIRKVTAEEITEYLNSLKQGDISDKELQRELFSGFVTAVYLYDDGKFKITTGCGGIGTTENKSNQATSEDVRISSEMGHQSN